MNLADFRGDLLTFTAALFFSQHSFRMGTRSPLSLSYFYVFLEPLLNLSTCTQSTLTPVRSVFDHRQIHLISNALIVLITCHYMLLQLDPYVILNTQRLDNYPSILLACGTIYRRVFWCFTLARHSGKLFRLSKHDITHYTITSLRTKTSPNPLLKMLKRPTYIFQICSGIFVEVWMHSRSFQWQFLGCHTNTHQFNLVSAMFVYGCSFLFEPVARAVNVL